MAMWQANRLAAPLRLPRGVRRAARLGAGAAAGGGVRRRGDRPRRRRAGAQRRPDGRPARGGASVRRRRLAPAPHAAHRAVHAAGGDRRGDREGGGPRGGPHLARAGRAAGRRRGRPAAAVAACPGRHHRGACTSLDVVHQQEEEWAPTFAAAGRELRIEVSRDAHVLATPGALAQVLATLLENSLRHGGGAHDRPVPPSPGRAGRSSSRSRTRARACRTSWRRGSSSAATTSGAGTGLGPRAGPGPGRRRRRSARARPAPARGLRDLPGGRADVPRPRCRPAQGLAHLAAPDAPAPPRRDRSGTPSRVGPRRRREHQPPVEHVAERGPEHEADAVRRDVVRERRGQTEQVVRDEEARRPR